MPQPFWKSMGDFESQDIGIKIFSSVQVFYIESNMVNAFELHQESGGMGLESTVSGTKTRYC